MARARGKKEAERLICLAGVARRINADLNYVLKSRYVCVSAFFRN